MAKLNIKVEEKTLLKLTAADAGSFFYDDKTTGLVGKVGITANGKVSVSFCYRFRSADGRVRDYGCGSWPKTPLAKIRIARNTAHALVDSGRDPVEVGKAKREAARAQQQQDKPLTVRGLFDLWKASKLTTRKDGGAEPERSLEKDVFPKLGKRPAQSLTRGELLALLEVVAVRAPAAANKLFGYLNSMFAWAVARERVPVNPLALTTREEVGGADGERDRVLSDNELRALPAALAGSSLADRVRCGLLVLLGTGARSGELLRARKDDINVQERQWFIPVEHSKTKKAHTIYLSDWVLPHVQALLALAGGSVWLMPDPADPTQHVHNKTLINAVADRQLTFYSRKVEGRSLNYAHTLELGVERWTPHDLRRTAATIMGDLDVQPDVIDRCLAHAERNKVRRTYQRAVKAEQQVQAWTALGERLAVLIPLSSEVAPASVVTVA